MGDGMADPDKVKERRLQAISIIDEREKIEISGKDFLLMLDMQLAMTEMMQSLTLAILAIEGGESSVEPLRRSSEKNEEVVAILNQLLTSVAGVTDHE